MSDNVNRREFTKLLGLVGSFSWLASAQEPEFNAETKKLLNRLISRFSAAPYTEADAGKVREAIQQASKGEPAAARDMMEYKNEDGDTLLLAGSKNRSTSSRDAIVSGLLVYCRPRALNMQDVNGNSALMNLVAQDKLNPRAITELLNAGADVNIRNAQGQSAPQIYKEKHPDGPYTFFDRQKTRTPKSGPAI